MTFRRIALLIGCCAAAAFAGPALAEIKWTFKFSDQGCTTSSCPGGFGNTRNASSVSGTPLPLPATNTVTARAWADTVGKNDGTAGNPVSGNIESAYLSTWSGGLGVQTRDGVTLPGSPSGGGLQDGVEGASPEHAMDNNERYEAIQFSFDYKVTLTGVEIGWSNTDSDIFVMAFTGVGPAIVEGLTFSQLASNGWTLVGNYADLQTNTKVAVNNGPTVYSSKDWLIGTYNPALGGSCTYTNPSGEKKCDKGDDYVKLLALYGEKTKQVPEPGALLLFGAALAGIWATRRRKLA
jgi:hypothetical protein